MVYRTLALISLFLTLTITPSVLAMGSGNTWTSDWWNNVYEQRIEPEQYNEIKKKEKNRCGYKIEWYTKKLKENPNSDYYKFKLEDWKKRCK